MKIAAVFIVLAAASVLIAGVWNFVDKYEGEASTQTPVPTLAAWTGPEGSPVPRNVMETFIGPAHCDWESTLMLFTGDPLGTQMDRRERFQPELGLYRRQYVRDPEGVLPQDQLLSAYDADVERPPTAAPTGYSWAGKEMWVDTANPDAAAYVVYEDHIERWPRAATPILCD